MIDKQIYDASLGKIAINLEEIGAEPPMDLDKKRDRKRMSKDQFSKKEVCTSNSNIIRSNSKKKPASTSGLICISRDSMLPMQR